MPSITAPGIGSGLDINGIINSLMSIERQPVNALNERQRELEAQLSAYGTLKGAISEFQSAMKDLSSLSKFDINAVTSSNESVFTASATSAAVPGSFTIDFSNDGTNQLAVAHKMNSVDFADSATSIGATGALEISVGGSAFTVNIDATNDTLDGIKAAINAATDNTGVTATVVNVDSGSRLILTSDQTGTAQGITITTGAVATALNMTDVTAAADAVFQLDGNLVTSSSNTVTGVIEGVTLELQALGAAGTTETVTVSRDLAAVKENVQAFVDKYNSLRGTLGFLSKDSLDGDSTLRGIESQFRTILNTAPTGLTTTLSSLSEIGITTLRSGDLELDQSVLDTALADDFKGVSELLADDDQGYAFRLEALATDMLSEDGTIDVRETGINNRIDVVKDDIEGYEFRLTLIEQRYRKQFGALDVLISGMNSTASFLAAQLGSLPG